MTEKQAKVIIALADNNMNVQATADSLFYHRNTISYRLVGIYAQTGKNPLNFYDLCELLPIARAVVNNFDTILNMENGKWKSEEL